MIIPIYLINLDRAQDRREYMLGELARLLPEARVERTLAVDIKSPDWSPPSDYSPGRWKSDRWALGPSDIEIFRSHLDAWGKIAASGKNGIILEDDVLFSDQFGDCVRALFEANAEGIIRLDATGNPALLEPACLQVGIFGLHQLRSQGASAAAYMLDSATAAKLAAEARTERTLDDFLFDPYAPERGARGHGLDIFQLEPVVALQAQFGTFNTASRDMPDFLLVTKRVDVANRKNKEFRGPFLYRLKKEFLRAKHRRAQVIRIHYVLAKGGSYRVIETASDLRWT
jgi:glycosyl transferase family 25